MRCIRSLVAAWARHERHAAGKGPEKEQLKLGFIKLTDMAPLAIAYEKGYFEDEGLYVTLEPQANWKVILDRVITGELDGAHMLAGQPLGASVGIGTKADVVTGFSMDLNGNAITVSNEVWALMKAGLATDEKGLPKHPIPADRAQARAREIQGRRASRSRWRWSSPCPRTTTSCATGSRPAASIPVSIRPSDVTGQTRADILISVTPPPQMPATLEAGTINGYSRGRALEPAGHLQGRRRAGHHRLRNLEEQSGKGVRRHQGVRRQESATRTSRWSRR